MNDFKTKTLNTYFIYYFLNVNYNKTNLFYSLIITNKIYN